MGAVAVGAASVGAASVGAASVGAASVGAAAPGRASAGRDGDRDNAPGGPGAGRGGSATGSISPAGAGGGSGRVAAGTRSAAPGVPDDGFEGSGDAEPEGGLRGAGAELRQKLRTERRLRLITLVSLAALVLLVLPAFFGVRAMSSDPVLASLDSLQVPAWAAKNEKEFESGNSLCIMECEFRERVTDSEQPFTETSKVYTTALKSAGWTERKVAGCPESPIREDEGVYTCWERDELTLDLAVSLPGCAVDQFAAEQNPSAGAEPVEPAAPGECVGSTVRIKVWNAIVDERGKTDTAPGPVGQTPDPILRTDDSIFQQSSPTPEAS
ncbi:hypothetical protein CLV67_114132 [Actinoplanes italicus]|uniref:Integrin beta 3 n=2 Tax=Actinoplanes italicus TaxID=113567 RepID=A0A2T0K5L7_9ACTN|nr:hypothetical protein CLV67_114132 [Actinoplanes italicus]